VLSLVDVIFLGRQTFGEDSPLTESRQTVLLEPGTHWLPLETKPHETLVDIMLAHIA